MNKRYFIFIFSLFLFIALFPINRAMSSSTPKSYCQSLWYSVDGHLLSNVRQISSYSASLCEDVVANQMLGREDDRYELIQINLISSVNTSAIVSDTYTFYRKPTDEDKDDYFCGQDPEDVIIPANIEDNIPSGTAYTQVNGLGVFVEAALAILGSAIMGIFMGMLIRRSLGWDL
jgi:hypothetical protein